MSKLIEVKEQSEELQNNYQKYLPKVDPDIINHLLTRQGENLWSPDIINHLLTRQGENLWSPQSICQRSLPIKELYD